MGLGEAKSLVAIRRRFYACCYIGQRILQHAAFNLTPLLCRRQSHAGPCDELPAEQRVPQRLSIRSGKVPVGI